MTTLWTLVALAAFAWPSHVLGPFDGVPFDGRAEAVVIGTLLPICWWFDRRFLRLTLVRVALLCLLAAKLAGLAVAQEGLCARFSTAAPVSGSVQTIPVEEPLGFLRSWDIRADWRSTTPRCTAIIGQSLAATETFPAWFLNITDFLAGGRRDLDLALTGYLTTDSEGTLSLGVGDTMAVSGSVGGQVIPETHGGSIELRLGPGQHRVNLDAHLSGEQWRLQALWRGEDAWGRGLFATTETGPYERPLRSALGGLTTAVAAGLMLAWLGHVLLTSGLSIPLVAWTCLASLAMVALAGVPQWQRFAGLVLLGAAAVPVGSRWRNLRGVMLLVGVPWLCFVGRLAWPQIGRLSIYSADDWLTYQVAGYRIFMGGYWLEGGNHTFDYQPLYRWISGALHLAFGDSSVGEIYWDGACLLTAALLAYAVARRLAGYRAGVMAAAGTLAICVLSTVWFFIGRGLSEIAAAGWASSAALLLLQARSGRVRVAVGAGLAATLMFYTRLNHLVFGFALAALLLPSTAPMALAGLRAGVARARVRPLAVYVMVYVTGILLFMARTWWYTGVFSLFLGTSLKNNDTGLRTVALASAAVWRNVGHSLSSLVWLNEPPHPDPRTLVVAAGVGLAGLAFLQVPRVRAVPASAVLATLGATFSAWFVHTHNYPGRMSIHLVPFAVALAVGVAATLPAGLRLADDPRGSRTESLP